MTKSRADKHRESVARLINEVNQVRRDADLKRDASQREIVDLTMQVKRWRRLALLLGDLVAKLTTEKINGADKGYEA